MHIIVRKHATHKGFVPHYNRALGKYYRTKDDYLGDMKKQGLAPYDSTVHRHEDKVYKTSDWAREMIKVKNPGDKWINEIKKTGYDFGELGRKAQAQRLARESNGQGGFE